MKVWFYLISVWTDEDFRAEMSQASVNYYDVYAQIKKIPVEYIFSTYSMAIDFLVSSILCIIVYNQ